MPKRKKKLAVRRRPFLAKQPYRVEDGVTQSLLTTWANCRIRALWYLKGVRSRTLNEPMSHGSFMHALFERMYRGVRAGTVTRESAPELFWPFADEWIKKLRGWVTAQDLRKAELIIAKAAVVFEHYCQHWVADFEPAEWLEVEGKFDVPFRGRRLRGMVDGARIVRPKRARKTNPWDLWILETKNRGQVKASADKTLALSFQNRFYLTAWRVMLRERGLDAKLKGVLQNVVRRPLHKLGKNESLQDYTKRVRAKVEEDPSYWFMRSEVAYPKEVMARFEDELEVMLKLFEAWVIDGFEPSYANTRACDSGGTCEYLDACASNGCIAGYRTDGRLFEELED
jgi:hypothetical protein